MTATPAAPGHSYDEVPYDSHPFAQSHPSRLYVVGTLFGMRPAPLHRCRVLELGCAAGGNLIPMADALRDSEFVGVDQSTRQIDDGLGLVKELGLTNVALKRASILDIDESYGKFDYVIAHGVFSWVPTAVQEKIFEIAAKHLNPNGIAYISYNTYPGWHMRGMIRDMMRYHSGRFNTPQIRIQQSRALLDFLAQSVRGEGPYPGLLKQELESVRTQADHYLYHEHLEEVNDPVYFHQFAERAKAKGLRYLGEARVQSMLTGNFGPDVDKTLRMLAPDQIQIEQYMDFLRNRMFRETLLCLERVTPNWSVQPECLRGLHIASAAQPVQPDGKPLAAPIDIASEENVGYKGPGGVTMATARPLLKAAMQALSQAFPGTIPFDELRKIARDKLGVNPSDPKQTADDTQVLAVGLLNCYMGSDLIELHGMPVTFNRVPSEMPTALPIARATATRAGVAITRRHEVVKLNDLDRQLIPILDGTNDRGAIVDKLAKVALTGVLNVQKDGKPLDDPKEIREAIDSIIEKALQNVARMGVLV